MGFELNYDKDSKERMPWEHYMELYAKADPHEISSRLEIPYDEETKTFTFSFMGSVYHVTHPDFQVTHEEDGVGYYPLEQMIYAKILGVRYLLNASNMPAAGKYMTYREMPWGNVYLQQFNGRCIMRFAFSYGNKIEKFCQVMKRLNAREVHFGDCAYEVELFQGLYVQLILWAGDEEFPPSSQILFSDNFPASFEAEDMAVSGDVIIGTLKAVEKILE